MAEVQSQTYPSASFSHPYPGQHWNHDQYRGLGANSQESWGGGGQPERSTDHAWLQSRLLLVEHEHKTRHMPPGSPPRPGSVSNAVPPLYRATSYRQDAGEQQEPDAKRQQVGVVESSTILPPVSSLPGFSGQLPPPASGDTGSSGTSRAIGFQSILNPADDPETTYNVRGSDALIRRRASGTAISTPVALFSPRIRKRQDVPPSPQQAQSGSATRHPRRMLTPKSPALRAASQNTRRSPSAAGSLRYSVTPGVYTAELSDARGGIFPPLSTPYGGRVSGYGIPMPSTEGSIGSAPAGHAGVTSAYSAMTPVYTGSPGGSSSTQDREDASPQNVSSLEIIPRSAATRHMVLSHEGLGRSYSRPFSHAQPNLQMQLDTETGPINIPVEVDVQQASRLADEKRKRNAGASARFRQRRKEKELASTHQISDLNRRLRELQDEREHYRRERDYYRDLVEHIQGSVGPPRPPTPHGRGRGAVHDTTMDIQYVRRSTDEHGVVSRRRIEEHALGYPPGSTAPSNYLSSYQPGPSTFLPPPRPTPGVLPSANLLPEIRGPPVTALGARSPPASLSVSSQPHTSTTYEPYTRDMGPR